MRKTIFVLLTTLFIGSAFTSDKEAFYTPVFMSRKTLESSVSYTTPRQMQNIGKVYYKAPYIYVNERYKGVHIINNTNPTSPINEGFILAPGCIDIAISGNVMYLDNAVDLVAIDLSSKTLVKRVKNVFPEPIAPGRHQLVENRPSDYILVGWKK